MSSSNEEFIKTVIAPPKDFTVVLGVIHGAHVDGWYFQSFADILLKKRPPGFNFDPDTPVVMVRSGPLLSQARGHLIGNFLEASTADAIVMIDADQAFDYETFWNLVACYKAMKETYPDVGIVAGVTWMTGHPKLAVPKPNIWHIGKHPTHFLHADTYPADAIMEVGSVGCSNMVVGRDICDVLVNRSDHQVNPFHHLPAGIDWNAMAADFAGWDDPTKIAETLRDTIYDADQLGEDMSFCTRVRAAGFRILVNTNLEFAHSKNYLLDGDDYRAALAKDQEPRT